MHINIPTKGNAKLETIMERVRSSTKLETFLACSNMNAIDRMGINDHGPIHVTIAANIALKLLRNLTEAGFIPNVVKDHKMTNEDAEVIVVLAALMHDLGHVMHRKSHPRFSSSIALTILPEFLEGVYDEKEATIIISDILHAITAHDSEFTAFTLEAGCVRLADGLDLKEGRARIPYQEGCVNIHSVSAMAIDDVEIKSGKKPIEIKIKMGNSAGIFQVDSLLRGKLNGSGLEDYVSITAVIEGNEKKIIDKFELN